MAGTVGDSSNNLGKFLVLPLEDYDQGYAGDASIAVFSEKTLKMLNLYRGDTISIEGEYASLFIALSKNTIPDDIVAVNYIAMKNIRSRSGKEVVISRVPDVQYCKRVAILPMADTIVGYSGDMFSDFMKPYFMEAYRPVTKGDIIMFNHAGREVEFKVTAVDPEEWAIVAQDTIIHTEGDFLPRQKEWPLSDEFGGYNERRSELQNLMHAAFENVQGSEAMRSRVPRGVLLHGPVGSGKASLLQVLAFERRNFFVFITTGPDLLRDYKESIPRMFKDLGDHLPSLAIIENIDLLGDTKSNAVVEFIRHMDMHKDVVLLCTTNRLSSVASELLGTGRIEKIMELGVPSRADRLDMLKIQTRGLKLDSKVSCEELAGLTEGFLASDLASLCNRASATAMKASTRGPFRERRYERYPRYAPPITRDDFLTALRIEEANVQGRTNDGVTHPASDSISQPVPEFSNMTIGSHNAEEPPVYSEAVQILYSGACIFSTGVEFAAGLAMLDEKHHESGAFRTSSGYSVSGQIGQHSVLMIMPEAGKEGQIVQLFSKISAQISALSFIMLVGVGSGIPSRTSDIRLGDVLVGQGSNSDGGCSQVKVTQVSKRVSLFKKEKVASFSKLNSSCKPPTALSSIIQKLTTAHNLDGSRISKIIAQAMHQKPAIRAKYSRPELKDLLYKSEYHHNSQHKPCEQGCDLRQVIARRARTDNEPQVHYGNICSVNSLIQDTWIRDELAKTMKAIGVETTASGLDQDVPCLIIRGVCNYADSHADSEWEPYASLAAAAYMKELILQVP